MFGVLELMTGAGERGNFSHLGESFAVSTITMRRMMAS